MGQECFHYKKRLQLNYRHLKLIISIYNYKNK